MSLSLPIFLPTLKYLINCSNLIQFLPFVYIGAGKTRSRDAALNAIQSPLLDIGIERATGIVWNITGGSDLTLYEVWFSLFPSPPANQLIYIS